MKKILIVYANSGAGHRRAAEALFAVAEKNFPSVQVKLLDVLDYTSAAFRRSYPATYLFMVNHCPKLWGFCFYLLDNRQVDKIARVFRRKTNSVHGQPFMKFLLEEDPDLILTTHFLPNELISCLKKRHKFQAPLITCITDYYPHAWWRDSGVDLYIAPNQDLVPQLLRLGIAETNIATLGIPIHPNFAVSIEQTIIRWKLGLVEDQFTVLITSGGFGVGPIRKLVAHLNRISTPLQFVVICGNNLKLQDELIAVTKKTIHSIRIFGFVQNMQEFMAVSDLMISKSGGLTSTEAMAKGLPLIALRPIPGQESSNCAFLLKQKAGIRVKNERQACNAVEDLLHNPDKLQELRRNMTRIGRPHAAEEIISYVKKFFKIDEAG